MKIVYKNSNNHNFRVASSREQIRTGDFHEYNKHVYLLCLEMCPWYPIPPSVHGLFHSGQFIKEFNDGKGLAQLSESPLESCHKRLR